MKCIECGEEIPNAISICPKCGKIVDTKNNLEPTIITEQKEPVLESVEKKENSENQEYLNNCPQCNQKLEKNWNYCSNCGYIIKVEKKEIQKEETKKQPKETSEKALLYIVLYIMSMIFGFTFSPYGWIIAIIIIITGKINCPKNWVISFFFWVTIILLVIGIINTIMLMIVCQSMIKSCPG